MGKADVDVLVGCLVSICVTVRYRLMPIGQARVLPYSVHNLNAI